MSMFSEIDASSDCNFIIVLSIAHRYQLQCIAFNNKVKIDLPVKVVSCHEQD